MSGHEEWVRQLDAELDGELNLVERAALARHLAICSACAGARASHLEVRVALARSTGDPHAPARPSTNSPSSRSRKRPRGITIWIAASLLVAAASGWFAHARWGGPGPGSLEGSRAAFVVN